MNSVFSKSSANLRVFALILTFLCCSAAVTDQEKGATLGQKQNVTTENPPVTSGGTDGAKTSPTQSKENNGALPDSSVAAPSAEATKTSANKDAGTLANDYKIGLNSLSNLYQNEVQRLEQKNNQWEKLFKDRLVSAAEM